MIKWNFAWVCFVTSIAYAAESELSLSSLLQTHQSSSKIQARDFLSFTFNGSSAGNINYLQLCTASSGTDCTTCNTNITPITSGTALPYASGGTTYGMNTSAIAAYLTQNSASSGTYYIGLYVQSQELACNSGASYCSSNVDTAGGRLCFSVDYDASTPAAGNLALVNNTGVAPLTTATAPIVLSAAGQTTPSQLISIANDTGAPTYLTLPNVSLMNAVNCRNPGVICTAIGSNSSSNQVLYRSTSDQKVWTNAVTLSSGGVFHSTSCSVSGSTWYCTAVGKDSSNNPLLYTGTNASGSEVWSAISLTTPAGLASGDLNATSCIGGNPITCVAAGQYSDGTSTYPLLYSGTYSSNAWVWTLVTTTSDTGVFNAASCSGSGAKPFCVAAGQDTTTNTPLLYLGTGFLTNSGGVVTGSLSWESVATTTNNALYNAASCAGASGASGTSSPNWNVICAVAGVDTTAGNSLIYVGTGTNITSGTTPASFTAWTPVTTTTSGGTFEVIGCSHSSGSGTNSNYICTAAGNSGTATPLVYFGTDLSVGGSSSWSTWYPIPSAAYLQNVNYTGASCSGATSTGGVGLCSVVGNNTVTANSVMANSTITSSVNAGGPTWTQVSVSSSPGEFNGLSCNASLFCLVAAQFTSTPLLLTSLNAGSSWATVPLSSISADVGSFYSTSCSDNSPAALCAAVGINQTAATPLIYVSTNQGSSWSMPTLSYPSGTSPQFNGTSCTGSGSQGVCTAVGQYANASLGVLNPLLYVSQDGGSTWSTNITLSSPPLVSNPNYLLNSTSCTGSGNAAMCVAAGDYYVGAGSPTTLLYQSVNGGSSWNLASPSQVNNTAFYASSCTGSGASTGCVVGGGNSSSSTNTPVLYVGTGSSLTWSAVTVSVGGTPINGVIHSVKCTGSGSSAVCLAVGVDNTNNVPLLLESTNGGTTWDSSGINYGTTGVFYGASCTTGARTLCSVAGLLGTQPALYVGQWNGASWTWSSSNLLAAANAGVLESTSCVGSDATAVCTASGQDTSTTLSFLIVLSNLNTASPTVTATNTSTFGLGTLLATAP